MDIDKGAILKAVVPAVVPMVEQMVESKFPELMKEIDKIDNEYVKLVVKGLTPAVKEVVVALMKKASEKYV